MANYTTGSAYLDDAIDEIITLAGGAPHADLIREILITGIKLIQDGAGRGDLKLLSSAMKELRYAFKVFQPYQSIRKVSIFGSARIEPDDPAYVSARDFAKAMANAGWMAITGAGPGIMQAGSEGAGRERSFGVNIRLPFEQMANPAIDQDPKLINFKYFFTRKIMFVKEAEAVCLLPGGFGTLDEGFETLTLIQTGKAPVVPLVLLDTPESNYWATWSSFIENELAGRGLISPEDLGLFYNTNSAEDGVSHILKFYRNYHSQRFVRRELVLRVAFPVRKELRQELDDTFRDILRDGEGRFKAPKKPLPEEANEPQLAHYHRLVFPFDQHGYGRLRQLIDRINEEPEPGE